MSLQDSSASPEVRSQAIVNVTSRSNNFTTDDVSIAALVIEDLTSDAITNEEVCLTVIVSLFPRQSRGGDRKPGDEAKSS